MDTGGTTGLTALGRAALDAITQQVADIAPALAAQLAAVT